MVKKMPKFSIQKDSKIFYSKGFQNFPNLGVWFENKISGNRDFETVSHLFQLQLFFFDGLGIQGSML
jgi:hypothetical protein